MKQEKVVILALAVVAIIAAISGCIEQAPTGPTVSGEGYALLWSRQVSSQSPRVSISSDGSYVAVRSGSYLHLYDKEGKLLWSHSESEFGPGAHFDPLSVSSDGSYVAVGDLLFDRDGKLLWQQNPLVTRVLKKETPGYREYIGHSWTATDVSISSDGVYIAVGRGGSSTYPPTPETVGRYVYLYNREGNLLWNYTTGWSAKWGGVRGVAISSDGNYVAAGSGDAYVYFFNREGKLLWSYRTGDMLCTFGTRDNITSRICGEGTIGAVSVSSDGSYVAVGAYDGNVYLFSRDGRLLWNYSRPVEDIIKEREAFFGKLPGAYLYFTGLQSPPFNDVLISSDGSYVVAMDSGGYVYLLDRDGKLLWRGAEICVGIGPSSRCGGLANSISISSDASYIAVEGRDGKVYIYNREGDLVFINPFESISISSDGSYVAAGASAGKIYLFGKGAAQQSATTGVGTNISEAVGKEAVSKLGWITHTYEDKQMGYAFSFDTPKDWVASGPVGERGVGGWYNPEHPKPPSSKAVWCYWITVTSTSETMPPLGDPVEITLGQRKVSAVKVKGGWAYHLICVLPVEVFDQEAQTIEKILESLRPLS